MRISSVTFVATVVALSAGVSAQAPANTVPFAIGGTGFEVPLPAGYCLPTGDDLENARWAAEQDGANATPVDVERCGTFGEDYILIKHPRDIAPITVEKSVFLGYVQDMLQTQHGMDEVRQAADQAGAEMNENTGGEIQMGAPDIRYAGADEDCVYLTGTIPLTAGGTSSVARVGTCFTLVGATHMVVHSYDFRPNGASFETLTARSGAVARSVVQK